MDDSLRRSVIDGVLRGFTLLEAASGIYVYGYVRYCQPTIASTMTSSLIYNLHAYQLFPPHKIIAPRDAETCKTLPIEARSSNAKTLSTEYHPQHGFPTTSHQNLRKSSCECVEFVSSCVESCRLDRGRYRLCIVCAFVVVTLLLGGASDSTLHFSWLVCESVA